MNDDVLNQMKKKTAILILACSEYESLELSLASHSKFTVNSGIPIFILQNGRGTYDTERTYSVAKRYQNLFPRTIKVIDHIPPQSPYKALLQLFEDELFSEFDFVIKLDDDVMVLTPDWVDRLLECYINYNANVEGEIAYVTSLINNNPFGFKALIDRNKDLGEEYFSKIAREHKVGAYIDDSMNPYRIIPKEEIYSGGYGTIWGLPYVARWLHKRTTLDPEFYIKAVKNYETVELDSRERYSINCILFKKTLWKDIGDYGSDNRDNDELMLHEYCFFNGKKIFADLSIPMVHIAFYSQRAEIRDMIPEIRDCYKDFLALSFPISMCENKEIELEDRLRFLEDEKKKRASYKMGKFVIEKLKKFYKKCHSVYHNLFQKLF